MCSFAVANAPEKYKRFGYARHIAIATVGEACNAYKYMLLNRCWND